MSLAAQGPGRAPRRWRFVMPVQAGLASLTGQYHSRGGGVVNTPRVHSQLISCLTTSSCSCTRVAFALPASAPLCRRRHSARELPNCRLRPAAPRTHAAQVHCRSSLVDNCILVTVVWKLRLLVPRLFSPAVHWMRGKLQFAQLRER